LRLLLFGATGMVGSAVLGELVNDDSVIAVRVVGRSPCGIRHAKVDEVLVPDLFNIASAQDTLTGFDGCIFALGTSSVGMSESAYTRITHDLAVAVAHTLLAANPGLAMVFVSGAGTDGTGQGRTMWARVKGRTENALLAMPFSHAVMIRLGGLVPPRGFRSKTRWMRWLYLVMRPLFPLLRWLFPSLIITPKRLTHAMLKALRGQAGKPRLEPRDLNAVGA
jgi:uncharacterized protein YbjT (DUF2867 family)